MAGVLKARDADGTLRTITAPKVRDTDGTLRTLQFIRVRDTDGTLREVFTVSGGGGGGGTPSNPTSITPGSRYLSGRVVYRSAQFTASSSGTAPTSFTWGLLDGNGSVTAGGDTATATLQVYADAGEYAESTFFCDMVVDGQTYRATCTFAYQNTNNGGGGTFPRQNEVLQ